MATRLGELTVERDGAVTIVRSSMPDWMRLLLIPAGWLLWMIVQRGELTAGALAAFIIAAALTFLGLPRTVIARIDPKARNVTHMLTAAWGLYRRELVYRFEEVAGLGVDEGFNGQGYACMPKLRLSNGRNRLLAVLNGPAVTNSRLLDEVCATTGLARVDRTL